jgi:hypothetical protein
MKTKDFIKMLQEEDPSGEGYLRIGDGNPITFMTQKEGYWDGPYSYIEQGEDGKPIWVQTTKGYKVDVYTMDLYDFAERFQGNWEEMKKHIKVEYTYLDGGKSEEGFMKVAEKECKEYKDMKDKFYEEGYKDMVENAKKGWSWFQDKKVDGDDKPNWYVYYHWKVYDENGKDQGSCIRNTESVQKSGDWERVDNKKKKGYYQWIYKNN